MKTTVLSLLLLLLPLANASAIDDCSSDLGTLRALYYLRQVLLAPASSVYDMNSEVDRLIDEMREPIGGGEYRWIRYVRPSGEPPIEKKEHLVVAAVDSGDRDTFEADDEHAYAVRVAVPRKRSLVKSNKAVFVYKVTIRYWVDDEPREMEKVIDQWMAPDTSRTFDLGVIADRVEVAAEAATSARTRREALVEIHFKQAVAEDDPANPLYDTIALLKRLRTEVDPVALDYEIAKAEKRLFGDLVSVPWTTATVRLREAEALLRSEKPEEQETGRKLLADVVRLVR